MCLKTGKNIYIIENHYYNVFFQILMKIKKY